MAIFYQNFGFDLAVGRRFVGQFRTRLLSSNRNMDPIRPTTTTTNISRRPPLIGYAFCRAARSVSHFVGPLVRLRILVEPSSILAIFYSQSPKKKNRKKKLKEIWKFLWLSTEFGIQELGRIFSLHFPTWKSLTTHKHARARALSLSLSHFSSTEFLTNFNQHKKILHRFFSLLPAHRYNRIT